MYVNSISKDFNTIKLNPTSNLGMHTNLSELNKAMAYGGLTLTDLNVPKNLDLSAEGQIALSQGAAWANAYDYLERTQSYLDHYENGHFGVYSADDTLNFLRLFKAYLAKSDRELQDTGMTPEDISSLKDYIIVTHEIDMALSSGRSYKNITESLLNILNNDNTNSFPENSAAEKLQSFQNSMLQAIQTGRSLDGIGTIYRAFASDAANRFSYMLFTSKNQYYQRNAPWNNIGRHSVQPDEFKLETNPLTP
jgi:hypothetical protein